VSRRSLAAAATPSAPDDRQLIDTLFIVQDNALWVAGCRRPAASLFALVAVLSSCRHKDVICAMAQGASGPNHVQPQVHTMASPDTPFVPDLHFVPATRCSARERS
jgi:hypothetical protein